VFEDDDDSYRDKEGNLLSYGVDINIFERLHYVDILTAQLYGLFYVANLSCCVLLSPSMVVATKDLAKELFFLP
jgi:hypothetical protein